MRYESSAAFRRALEERLRQQALTSGTPLARLRKMIAFERFLARLVAAQPDAWVLKGGVGASTTSARARSYYAGY